MKITIIGTGYVGLVSGVCFASMGNQVTCLDIDHHKISMLQQGISPIYESGLQDLLIKNLQKQTITFTTEPHIAYTDAQIIFIAVGTPTQQDGGADLSYVLQAAKEIGKHLKHYCVIVNKSTVPIGSAELVRRTIQTQLQHQNKQINFDVVSNPEFLKEGVAINDFMSPDRIIIGSDSAQAIEILKKLYAPFTLKKNRLIIMDIASAEMSKYAANAMLATKISFINEMARICEAVGADITKVREGIGSDPRIGYDFIYAGCGYGGSCFPKDIKALQKIAKYHHVQTRILQSIQEVNEEQKLLLAHKVIAQFGEKLQGKRFGIWGLSFKPETDDIRESPSIALIKFLHHLGAQLQVYDPQAINKTKLLLQEYTQITYYNEKYLALKDCDALLLLTEWKEFRSPDFSIIGSKLKSKILFDGRNIWHHLHPASMGFTYYGIGC